MVGQKTRGDEYLEIEQRKIELEEQLLDLQEKRLDIEQKRIELELRKLKLLSRKSKKKSKKNQAARDDSPEGAHAEGASRYGSNMDSEDDDDYDDYEKSIIGGAMPASDDDDDYEDDDDVEEEEPRKSIGKSGRKSSKRALKQQGSSSSDFGQANPELSPTASTSRSRRSSKRSSSTSKQRIPENADSTSSPLPPIGRKNKSSLKHSGSMSSDGGDDDINLTPALPPNLPPIAKAKIRRQESSDGSFKVGGRRMSRRGSAPGGTFIDNMPPPSDRRDSMTKHNSMRHFNAAQVSKKDGARAIAAASMSTVQADLDESEASMDLSVMTEKRSNKTPEQRPGPVVPPSLANNPGEALWK